MADEYCDQLKKSFKVLYANYPPGSPVALGDFGILNGSTFIRIGDVKTRFDIDPGLLDGVQGSATDYTYTSQGSVDVAFRASGTGSAPAIPIRAGIDISFSKQNSVFFNAAKCLPTLVKDQLALGEAVKNLYKARQWQREFVLVTTVLTSENSTIAISASSNSTLSLDASSDAVATIDLADAKLGLTVKSFKSIGFKAVTETGLTPLIGLSKVQGWFSSQFGPLSQPIQGVVSPKDESGLVFAPMLDE